MSKIRVRSHVSIAPTKFEAEKQSQRRNMGWGQTCGVVGRRKKLSYAVADISLS